ncbi:MAG: EscU/YscU/HrcU family type III secretion system export apparatus switch protein [Pseudomonadota bacterium]
MGAPRVVPKGADLLAMKFRDPARDSKVPMLQAQVLACVYQLRAALAGQVVMPNALPELNVPEELDPHHKPVPDMEIYD